MPRRTETSSIEVGSSAMITSGLTARARAMLMRWRWPPDSSCGYFGMISAGSSFTRVSSSAMAACALGALERGLMEAQRPLEVMADGVDRIERRERVLEHHLHRAAVGLEAADRARPRPAHRGTASGPSSGRYSRMIRRAAVVLPDPDSPTSARVRPGWSASDTERAA